MHGAHPIFLLNGLTREKLPVGKFHQAVVAIFWAYADRKYFGKSLIRDSVGPGGSVVGTYGFPGLLHIAPVETCSIKFAVVELKAVLSMAATFDWPR